MPHLRPVRRFARLLILANVLVFALLCAAVLTAARASRDSYTDKARQTVEALARSVAQGVAAEIRLVDNALLNLDRELQRAAVAGRLPDELLRSLLAEQRALVTHVDALRVSDAAGQVLGGEGGGMRAVGDQTFFQAARARPGMLAVSEPLRLGPGRWGVVLARARTAGDGRFQGVVLAELATEHFAELLDQVPVGPRGAVTLRSETLALVARHAPETGDGTTPMGQSMASDELRRALAAHRSQGFYVAETPLDGVERASAYRQVGSYPMLALVGLDTETFYAPWRRDVAQLLVLAGLVQVLLVVVSVLLWVYQHRQAREHQRAVRLAAEQQAVLNNELVGIARLQHRTLVWHNRTLADMLGYGPGELVGQSVRQIYPDEQTFERAAEAYALLAEGRPYRAQLPLARRDGGLIWVSLNGTPLPGGESLWVVLDISAVKASEADANHLAQHDLLTGLPNRLALRTRLEQAVCDTLASGRKLVVAYLDLDGFKPVNDTHGHEAGDRLLCEIAQRIVSCVRVRDIAARVGGDEFVVVLGDLGSLAEAEPVLHRLLDLIAQPVSLAGHGVVRVSASLGVVVCPDQARSVDALLASADDAMYAAKRDGKARIAFAGH